ALTEFASQTCFRLSGSALSGPLTKGGYGGVSRPSARDDPQLPLLRKGGDSPRALPGPCGRFPPRAVTVGAAQMYRGRWTVLTPAGRSTRSYRKDQVGAVPGVRSYGSPCAGQDWHHDVQIVTASRRLARVPHGGQEQPGQERDDRDRHQQLDRREARA